MKLLKEKVLSISDNRKILAMRINSTILVVPRKTRIIDSDQSFLEDKQGYRYKRNITFEQIVKNTNKLFTKI